MLHPMSGAAQDHRPLSQGGWYVQRAGDVLLLARRWPARFDLAVDVVFAGVGQGGSRARLAHQLRQDMWRCLQDLRGFWPVVRIARCGADLRVTIGGALQEGQGQQAQQRRGEATLEALLANPRHRARWLRHAGMKCEGVAA